MSGLRDYQEIAVASTRRAIAEGAKRICVVMPTGAGKTRTFAHVVALAVARGRRALWLAHRTELVDQGCAALVNLGLSVGAISPRATTAPQPFAPVQVATVQTLVARGHRPPADIIIADESHHYVAATFGALIRDYPDAVVIGPTATPERSDGVGLGDIYERLIVGASVRQLVDLGHLVPCEIIAPSSKLKTGQIAQRPVDAYLEHARGRRAICFSPTVDLAADHAADFAARGLRSGVVHQGTPWSERRGLLEALREGELDVLCNVQVATEGFDVPEISCVILARGFGSAGPYIQAVGRGLRPAPWAGKVDALILDLTGTSHVHGHPEEERFFSLEGRGIRRKDTLVDQPYCRVCGAPAISGESCPECGTAPKVAAPPVVTGERLVKFAKKRAEAPDARAATLRRWLNDARQKGYKPGWAYARYKAVYGGEPDAAVRAALRPPLPSPADVEAAS